MLIQGNGKRVLLVVATLCCLTQISQAAPTADQLLRGLMDTVQPTKADEAAAPTKKTFLYPTKKRFLKATEAGELAGFEGASYEDQQRVVESVQHILYREYKVPVFKGECYANGPFVGDVKALLSDFAAFHVTTLSNQAPDFIDTVPKQLVKRIQVRVEDLLKPQNPTHCDEKVMGKIAPNPYRQALASLIQDYSTATKNYVENERTRRKTEYQEAQAKQQEDERQRIAAAKAVEQQRIDAEAARIKQQEQKRAKKEKARVGG